MAAYTDSIGFTKGVAAFLDKHQNSVVRIEQVFDFAKIAAARVAAGVPALANTDTLELIPLPTNSLVLGVSAEVLKVEGATATMGVGDSGSATRYLTALDLNAASNVAGVTPFYNATGLPIRATFNHANIDVARVRVTVLYADMGKDRSV